MVPHMIPPGRRATVTTQVTPADLATALGSGDVPVLGTPRVLALLEQAAAESVRPDLDEESTTVGAWVDLEHLAPTPLGGSVTAVAELTDVDGRRLEFALEMTDADGAVVARGRHRRAVVKRARFAG